MKRHVLFATLPAMVLGALLAGLPSAAHAKSCSLAGTAGKYGFTLTGVLILPTGPVPLAAVGRAVLDAAGNVSGTESRSLGGGFADETFTGSYAVNPDCTGTSTLSFFQSGQLVRTSVLSFVFDDNEREIRMVQKSLTLPNNVSLPVVITVEAHRIFSEDDDQ